MDSIVALQIFARKDEFGKHQEYIHVEGTSKISSHRRPATHNTLEIVGIKAAANNALSQANGIPYPRQVGMRFPDKIAILDDSFGSARISYSGV